MAENSSCVVGVDVGGQTSKIGVVDRDGHVLARSIIRSDVYGKDASAFVDALAREILSCIDSCSKNGDVLGIGVGAPNANYYTGGIKFAPNLKWAADQDVPFRDMLSAATGGLSVTLTNDANAAAIGEMTYGAAKGMKNFIMITLGTGVGSGIVVDGKVLYGHDGFAGELGHVCVEREDGRKCGCGKYGCLESYCSAMGVAKTAQQWLQQSSEPSLLRTVENVSSKDVAEAASQGDALSLRVLESTGAILGRSFADFVAFSAPQAIVLFGGLTKAKAFFHDAMLRSMNQNLLDIWKGKVQILYSQLNESDAAILGASALAW